MENLCLVLAKKYDIHVCQDNAVELEGYHRIPLEVHEPITDIGPLTSLVASHGFRLVSENDASCNLKLYLQTDAAGSRWLAKVLSILIHCFLLFVATYLLLIKLKV